MTPAEPGYRQVPGRRARVVVVPAEVVRPLRQSVLRPGQPPEESVYPFDDHPETVHAAVVEPPAAAPLAVGSLLPEAPAARLAEQGASGPDGPEQWWRIRGMATTEDRRREGLGHAVLNRLLSQVEGQGGGLVWCNARVPAVAFYLRAGFQPVGEVFEVPVIGPHQAMWRAVAPA